MIPRGITALCAALCLALAPTAPTLHAQQDPPTAAQSKQQLAESKFRDLTNRMQKLMVVLQTDEPDESKLLGAGLRFVQEKQLHQRLEKNIMKRAEPTAGGGARQSTELLCNFDEDLLALFSEVSFWEKFSQNDTMDYC